MHIHRIHVAGVIVFFLERKCNAQREKSYPPRNQVSPSYFSPKQRHPGEKHSGENLTVE